MNAALEKYRDALKNPGLSNAAIAKMAKVPEADVVAARAEVAQAVEVVSEVAEQVEAVAEVVADVAAKVEAVADAVDAPKVEAVAEAVAEAAEIVEELAPAVKRHVYGARRVVQRITDILEDDDLDDDGDSDAKDLLLKIRAVVLAMLNPGKVETPKPVALTREPGSAVRALRTQRITDAKGKPWNVMFRDVYSGAQADFLASNHPGLVETYPRPKG